MRPAAQSLRGVFLISRKIGLWAMLEVLLLGVFVACSTKLGDLVSIDRSCCPRLGGARGSDRVAELALIRRRWGRGSNGAARRIAPMAPRTDAPSLPVAARLGGMRGCGLVSVPADGDGHCSRCGSACTNASRAASRAPGRWSLPPPCSTCRPTSIRC